MQMQMQGDRLGCFLFWTNLGRPSLVGFCFGCGQDCQYIGSGSTILRHGPGGPLIVSELQ